MENNMMVLKAILAALGLGKEVVAARTNLKVARIDAEATALQIASQDVANWEAFAAQNAANSWLDEWWTIVLSLPIIACFVPWLVPYIQKGFEALEIVPEWYVWAVFASVSFAFARKSLPDRSSWKFRKSG